MRDASPPTFHPRGRQHGFARRVRKLPWLILLLGLTLTILVWLDWHRQRVDMLHEDFRIQVSRIRTSIDVRVKANEQILRGVAGLFAVADRVSRVQFHDYVESLHLSEHYPGIRGVGFALRLAPEEVPAHIQAIRADGFPDYTPYPPGQREILSAIIYLEPFDWRNQRAFGYDMYAEPMRREAMRRAWTQGLAAMSGRVTLVQETQQDVQAGFLIYLPIYRNGQPHATPAEREANLLGWAYSPLRMKDLMTSLLEQSYPELAGRIRLRIHDGAEATADGLMFDSAPADEPLADGFVETARIEFGGHAWLLTARALPAFGARPAFLDPKGLIILGTGGALSLSLALLALTLIRTHLRVAEALRQIARAHRELSESQQRLQLIFDTSDVAIFLTDTEGRITQANERMAEMFRCPLGLLIGSEYVNRVHPAEREAGQRAMCDLLSNRSREVKLERRYRRDDGSEFWGHLGGRLVQDADGRPLGLVGVIADITQRKEAEDKIHFLAHHDYLTGLPNRALLIERLRQALALARRYRRCLGLLYLDLDGFKPVNDRHGHQVGDLLLKEVARRLEWSVRSSDTVCRQGGDEFVILVPELPDCSHLEVLARTLAAEIARPYAFAGFSLSITVSIGMALYPDHGETVEELMDRADAAMYRTKEVSHRGSSRASDRAAS